MSRRALDNGDGTLTRVDTREPEAASTEPDIRHAQPVSLRSVPRDRHRYRLSFRADKPQRELRILNFADEKAAMGLDRRR